MDIVTLAAARKGSGGGASKEYVDEKVAALINDTTAAQNKTYSSAKVEEKVAGEEITATATGSDLTLSTSAGNINALTVYGKSEVVDGGIKSAGEGWATVDLGTLNWQHSEAGVFFTGITNMKPATSTEERIQGLYCAKYQSSPSGTGWDDLENKHFQKVSTRFGIKDLSYTNTTLFKIAMSGVLLAYELADPTQGNAIAIKTDNGSGIDGTMATFSTGTPLYGVSDTIRDVMAWNGSAGTVTKVCGIITLNGSESWNVWTGTAFYCNPAMTPAVTVTNEQLPRLLSYLNAQTAVNIFDQNAYGVNVSGNTIRIRIENINNVSDLQTYLQSNPLTIVYELATPTTQSLTSTENASIAGLRTFAPQTHAQNNAGATMTVEAYAGTANGKAVNELKQDVQSEISELKIIQSSTLTLTVAGWSSNQQTVTYAHDTAKRNVIDVDPSSIEEWASCGILATAETASGITFTCKTVPENALNFRVTSMGVN